MSRRFDVFQELRIARVARDDTCVRVDVEHPGGGRHWITFRFDDRDGANHHAAVMEFWRAAETPLTYVRGRDHGVLVDDRELFRLAYEGDASTPF